MVTTNTSVVRTAITIKGVSPLLMNRLQEEDLLRLHSKEKAPRNAPRLAPEDEAKRKLYVKEDGKTFYLKTEALYSALVGAGTFIRLDGKRMLSNAKATLLPAFLMIEDSFLPLETKGWQVDIRQGKNPNGGEAVCIIRPRFDDWKFTVHVQIDTAEIGEDRIRQLFEYAGQRMGLLDFRPQRKGLYGRFVVEEWKRL